MVPQVRHGLVENFAKDPELLTMVGISLGVLQEDLEPQHPPITVLDILFDSTQGLIGIVWSVFELVDEFEGRQEVLEN